MSSSTRALVLALFVSSSGILVLSHGLFSSGPHFTGFLLILLTAVLLFPNAKFPLTPNFSDAIYGLFAISIAITFIKNGATADFREIALLILTLLAYPAGRLSAGINRSIFLWSTIAVVAMGTIATTISLAQQWNDPHGKPMVFNRFDAAPIQFLTSLGFALLAAICVKLDRKKTIWIVATLFIPTAIFGASQVRFTFLAIETAIFVALLVVEPSQRKHIASIMAVFAFAVLTGMLVRPSATQRYLRQELNFISPASAASGPIAEAATIHPTCSSVDTYDSISIREELLHEASRLIPNAGFFGIGLDSFKRTSCLRTFEIHNSLLQASLEFGWIGGALFLFLILSIFATLLPAARWDDEIRFVLCCLTFMTVESLAHGRISRDQLLLVFLGYGAALRYRSLKTHHDLEIESLEKFCLAQAAQAANEDTKGAFISLSKNYSTDSRIT